MKNKFLQISGTWTDLGYLTGISIPMMFFVHWSWIFVTIITILLEFLGKHKLNDAKRWEGVALCRKDDRFK